MHERGVPLISVDTKKKELFGNFKNAGQQWRPAGAPNDGAAHDGFVNVDTNRDTPYWSTSTIFRAMPSGKAIPYCYRARLLMGIEALPECASGSMAIARWRRRPECRWPS